MAFESVALYKVAAPGMAAVGYRGDRRVAPEAEAVQRTGVPGCP
jgi:hypothetical protein